MSPKLFYQVYTLNIILQGKNLPLVYVLLPDKVQSSYDKMFHLLLKAFQVVSVDPFLSEPLFENLPEKIAHDFEKGVLNSIISKFSKVIVFGCYFHFAQNLWYKLNIYPKSIYII